MKSRIKKVSTDYARRRTTENTIIIANLKEKINEYESKSTLSTEDEESLSASRADLEEKLLEKIRGIMFRSRVQWYEEGEKNTKYFFSLEKARYNAKTCYKLLDGEGVEVNDTKRILDMQREFYLDLYKEDADVEFNLKNNYSLYVPQKVKDVQNIQINFKDLEDAIKSMNNNKTPGEDGLPVDFYKVFWTHLKGVFYEMMCYNYEEGILHKTARKGILNLIPKQDKDTRYIKNLRPITLLNTDYKIIEKAVANKMILALEHIIHQDQRGFMKDRRISVNIRKMLDIIHIAQKEDLEAVVLSLDFVKCFDKCSFSILHGSLDYFQFGEVVKTWTKILYRDFTVKVQNNGCFSAEIPIHKGVHQGGCCSSVYFLVIAEILALALRSNENIDGITIHDIRNLLNQFADDMDIFSLCNESSLRTIFEELDKFKLQSGFTVSQEKTTLYRIGSLRHSSAQMYELSRYAWTNKDINVLGCTIAHDDIMAKNYNPVIEKVKKTLNAWYNRDLSLLGKVQVINTLVAFLFVYKMMVMPTIPHNIIMNVNNIFRDYLWNGKKAKIRLDILQNKKEDGGLQLVNLKWKDIALKSTWPIILSKEIDYATIVYTEIKAAGLGENVWRCYIEPSDIARLKIKNTFWEDVWRSWSEYNFFKNFRVENQLLWYNSKIRFKGKPFLWNDVCARGLLYVHQLFLQGNYKPEKLLYEQYGLTTLRYNSIKAAMPKEWKVFFMENPHQTFSPLPPHNIDIFKMTKGNLSRKVYNYIGSDATMLQNKLSLWNNDLGHELCEDIYSFGYLHKSLYALTNITKYRSFQYRLLQRGLVTNSHLYKWGLKNTDRCNFCRIEKESLVHMMYSCSSVQAFWSQVLVFLHEKHGVRDVSFNSKDVIKNTMCNSKVGNFICLAAKQYIYKQRCFEEDLKIQQFKGHIMHLQNIKKYVAIKNGKLSKHQAKWGNVDVNVESNNIDMYVQEYVAQM